MENEECSDAMARRSAPSSSHAEAIGADPSEPIAWGVAGDTSTWWSAGAASTEVVRPVSSGDERRLALGSPSIEATADEDCIDTVSRDVRCG